ncbi:MAG TPA: hypothetical protein DEH25_03655 [Chloroflexi bacterium]|nr:hypothetical protein [Chloroflexota bacterium]
MNTKIVQKICYGLFIFAVVLGGILVSHQNANAQEGILENIWVGPNQYFIYATGYTWGHSTVVDLTLTRAGSTIYTASAIVEESDGNPGYPIHYPDEVAYFDLYNQPSQPIDLQPDDVITLSGGGLTRTMVVPPLKSAVINPGARWAQRNTHVQRIQKVGSEAWKKETNYHRRSLAETAMFRLKIIFGPKLHNWVFDSQALEVRLRYKALNIITQLGMPEAYPVLAEA